MIEKILQFIKELFIKVDWNHPWLINFVFFIPGIILSIFLYIKSKQPSKNPLDINIEDLLKKFNKGEFNNTWNTLEEKLLQYKGESSIKYKLLILKTRFLITFKKYEDAQNCINLIKKSTNNDIIQNPSFITCQLEILIKKQKENDFNALLEESNLENLILEKKELYNIDYYIHSGDISKAKKIFDSISKADNSPTQEFLFLGTCLYALISLQDSTLNEVTKNLYNRVKENSLPLIKKLYLQSVLLMNKNLLKINLKKYKENLNLIIQAKQHFSSTYIKKVLEAYAETLFSLHQKEELIKFYNNYQKELSIRWHILLEKNLDHKKIQTAIKNRHTNNDLFSYIGYINYRGIAENEKIKILQFFSDNSGYAKNDTHIFYQFIKAHITLKKRLDPLWDLQIDNKKEKNIDTFLIYLEYQNYKKIKITDNDIDKLSTFFSKKNINELQIINTLTFLKELNQPEKYLNLGLNKQENFPEVIEFLLGLCKDDRELNFDTFNYFVEKIIDKEALSGSLGLLYEKYEKWDEVFKYLYINFQKNKNPEKGIDFLSKGIQCFQKTETKLATTQQSEIYQYLLTQSNNLSIIQLIYLIRWSQIFCEEIKTTLPLLNKRMLLNKLPLKREEQEEISRLNLYFMIEYNLNNKKEKELYFSKNSCLVQDNSVFINQEDYPELDNASISIQINTSISIQIINSATYLLNENNSAYKKTPLFSKLTSNGSFQALPGVTEIIIDHNSENPTKPFFDFLNSELKNGSNLFQKYSQGGNIWLYSLANKDYKNYFTIIPKLLEEDINFYSGAFHFLPSNTNKILTLSSIIFLNHINQLERILDRQDIYIQHTLINYLQLYIKTLNNLNQESFIGIKNGKYKITNNSSEDLQKRQKNLLTLLEKIINTKRIAKDEELVFPKKGVQEQFSSYGRQEIQAILYADKHKYQIITEDRCIGVFLQHCKIQKEVSGNSLALLEGQIDEGQLDKLRVELHNKKYKYVLDPQWINVLYTKIKDNSLKPNSHQIQLCKIADNYGFLEDIKSLCKEKKDTRFCHKSLQTILNLAKDQ